MANSLKNVIGIEIEPSHSLGSSKYQILVKNDNVCDFKMPANDTVKQWIEKLQKNTKIIVKKA